MDLGAGSWKGNTASCNKNDKLGTLRRADSFWARYPSDTDSWSKKGLWDEYHEFDYNRCVTDDSQVPRPSSLKGNTKFQYHNKLVSTKDNDLEIDFAKFMKDNFDKDRDFIFMKMDIENAEWDILPNLRDNNVLDWINELTIEIHFTTDDPRWAHFIKAAGMQSGSKFFNVGGEHSLKEAHNLLTNLRAEGIYSHTYP